MARQGRAIQPRDGADSELKSVDVQLQLAGLMPGGMRARILELMQSRTVPTTPEGLYRELFDYCCVSTVYRTMAELHRANLLERYRLPSGKLAYLVTRQDGALRLCCTRCGRVTFIESESLKEDVRQACLASGFSRDSVEFIGQCRTCAGDAVT